MKTGRLTVDARARALRREDLEGVVLPMPSAEALFDGLALARVTRLSRFWADEQGEHPARTRQAVVDWLAGLHGLGAPWLFAIRSDGARLECWFGAALAPAALRHALRGAFADARFGETALNRAAIGALTHAVAITGAPSARTDTPQIEKVCRTLTATGRAWCYALRADPVGEAEIRALANETADALFEMRIDHLGKGEPVLRPQAEQCAELLAARARRFEAARMTGLWRTRAALLAEDEATAQLAAGILRAAFAGTEAGPEPLRVHRCAAGAPLPEPPEPLSSLEAAVLARPPMEAYPGYELVDEARFGVEAPAAASGPAVSLGSILDRGRRTRTRFRVPLVDLTKHALIAGVTGSGKTNSCFRLLTQLWQVHRIPFLVIEPAKSEYRRLLANRRWRDDVRVFTVGQETIAPLRLHPFEVPRGVPVQSHIDYLKALFQAAFVLYPPMPHVLETALHEVYRERGWQLATNENPRGAGHARSFPTLDDLIARVRIVVARLGFTERLGPDIEASLVTRLESLRAGGGKGALFSGPSFSGSSSLSTGDLFDRPVIIELKQVVHEDEKAFVMGLLLIRLYEHHEARARDEGGEPVLRHVTLIEEAHRLLREVSTDASGDVANPRGQALEVFTNMLAEIRAYGEGMLIAEQIPSKLTRDVVKNTSLKIVHRLTSKDDRDLLGDAMHLAPAARAALTQLDRGTAAIFAERLQRPALTRVPRSALKDTTVRDAQVAEAMRTQRPAQPLAEHTDLDARTLRSFTRAFNACVQREAAFKMQLAAFTDLRQAIGRAGPTAGAAPLRDLWRRLADQEISRHAAFRGWPHTLVDRLVESCAAIGDLETQYDTALISLAMSESDAALRALRTRKKTLRAQLAEALAAFGAEWDALHAPDVELPYPGCAVCERPCLYRYQARVDVNATGDWFDARAEEAVEALTDAAIVWTAEVFHRGDGASIVEGGLCWTVQQIDRERIPAPTQEFLAARVKQRIAARLQGADDESI